MHVYVQAAAPWLNKHIKGFIKKHVQDAVFVDDFDDMPGNASSTFQYCDGWALNRNFAVLNRSERALLNAYPNSDALARKDYMSRVIEYWTAKNPESALKSNSPTTVRLSLDYAEYVDESLAAADDLTLLYSLEDNDSKPASEREWWILKPALVDCGAGIRLFSTMDELASHLELAEYEDEDEEEEESEEEVVAEAVEEKKDLHQQDGANSFSPTLRDPGLNSLDALITATGDMALNRVLDQAKRTPKRQQYVFKAGGRIPSAQMREFVAQQYVVSIPPMEKRKWHVRAYALSIGRLQVHVFKDLLALLAAEEYQPPWENPSLKASLTNTALQEEDEVEELRAMRDFWTAPDDVLPGDKWKESIFEQVCEVTSELFRAAQHTMADKFTTIPKSFELFAVDYLIDSSGKAWLLEVNETPAFYEQGMAGPLALRLMESVVCLTLEYMGAIEADQTANDGVKQRFVKVLDETDTLAKSRVTSIMPEY